MVWGIQYKYTRRRRASGARLRRVRREGLHPRIRGIHAPGREKMNVPFLDVRAGYRELKKDLDAAYRRVMDSGWYILGGEVESVRGGVRRLLRRRNIASAWATASRPWFSS